MKPSSQDISPKVGWGTFNLQINKHHYPIQYKLTEGNILNDVKVDVGKKIISFYINSTTPGDLDVQLSSLSDLIPLNREDGYTLNRDGSMYFIPDKNMLEVVHIEFGKDTKTIILCNGDMLESYKTKATPPREKPSQLMEPDPKMSAIPSAAEPRNRGNTYWNQMDDVLFRIMKIAENYYQINRKINLIIVIIGIVLLSNSIGYTWYKQAADAWSLFSGGIGIAAFMTLFFKNPQEAITKALGNLAQIQMIYKSHASEFETIRDYDYEKQQHGNRDLNEIIEMDKELERITEKYVDLVQKYVEETKTLN